MSVIENNQKAWWVIVHRDKILRCANSLDLVVGQWQSLPALQAYQDNAHYIGEVDDQPLMLVDMEAAHYPEDLYEAISLRAMLMALPEPFFPLVSRAWQVALFLRTHRFCGQCGSKMTRVDWELATHCHHCQHRCYPRISPCIIVAIRKGDQILLAHGRHHKNAMYSTLAGFVESGETLEQAVHREVFEEVGVRVENLRYFGSQPWPFPHSLMCGFLADFKSGDIKVDEKEILAADWFSMDELPNIPPVFSIAGQLIQQTRLDIESEHR